MNRDTLRLMLASYITTGLLAAALALVLVVTASNVSAKANACDAHQAPAVASPVVMVAMVGNRDIEQLSNGALASVEEALRSTFASNPLLKLVPLSSLKLKLMDRPTVEERGRGVTLVLPLEGSAKVGFVTGKFSFQLRAALRLDDAGGAVLIDFRDSDISDFQVSGGALGGSAAANFDIETLSRAVRLLPSIRCLHLGQLEVPGTPLSLRFSRLTAFRGQLVAEVRSDAAGLSEAGPLNLPTRPAEWQDASSIWIETKGVPVAASLMLDLTYPDGMNGDGNGSGPYRITVTQTKTDAGLATVGILAKRSGWLSGCVAFDTSIKPANGPSGGVIASDPKVRSCSLPSWLAWLLLPDGDAIGQAMTKAIESRAKATIRLPGNLAWSVRVANWTATPDWLGAKVNISEAPNAEPTR